MSEKIVLEKSKGFYKEFFRKDSLQSTTHYCPGCGHGKIHKLLAEALVDLGIQDRAVMISPVGCAVFAYYYFDCANIQAAHGRAPAVGTGVTRALDNSIVISYQGDGDLAAIGTAEIIHAANRGEKMTVIFVNNAIYGMTGGQMAPTSLEGQITLTTPYGRNPLTEGYPIRMSEIISTLKAPVYVERVAVHDYKHIMKARLSIRKALRSQIDGLGFSFVEIISPCPTSLRIPPVDCAKWVEEKMIPYYPLKVFKDEISLKTPYKIEHKKTDDIYKTLDIEETNTNRSSFKLKEDQRIRISGFGGQGVLSSGVILSQIGMKNKMQTSWLPSYGPAMRGGTANCHVNISSSQIGSPVIDEPNVLIAMNQASLDEFESIVSNGGKIFVNSSLVDRKVKRKDVEAIYIPATGICESFGLIAATNIVMIASYLKHLSVDKSVLIEEISCSLKRKELLDKNIEIVNQVYSLD